MEIALNEYVYHRQQAFSTCDNLSRFHYLLLLIIVSIFSNKQEDFYFQIEPHHHLIHY